MKKFDTESCKVYFNKILIIFKFYFNRTFQELSNFSMKLKILNELNWQKKQLTNLLGLDA